MRFSLRGLIVVLVFGAGAMLLMRAYDDLREVRQENQELRKKAVALELALENFQIEKPENVIARYRDIHGELTWEWRIWIPNDRKYKLRAAIMNVETEGFPAEAYCEMELPDGMSIAGARIREEAAAGEWRLFLTHEGGGNRSVGLPPHLEAWMKVRMRGAEDYISVNVNLRPQPQIELFRTKMPGGTGGEGLLIWLEERK